MISDNVGCIEISFYSKIHEEENLYDVKNHIVEIQFIGIVLV